jgi:hypothetical protein
MPQTPPNATNTPECHKHPRIAIYSSGSRFTKKLQRSRFIAGSLEIANPRSVARHRRCAEPADAGPADAEPADAHRQRRRGQARRARQLSISQASRERAVSRVREGREPQSSAQVRGVEKGCGVRVALHSRSPAGGVTTWRRTLRQQAQTWKYWIVRNPICQGLDLAQFSRESMTSVGVGNCRNYPASLFSFAIARVFQCCL